MIRQTVWAEFTVFYVKWGGKYNDYALNSKGYDEVSKNMLSFKPETDDALWRLLKDSRTDI
jgi:hypothetical protein